MVQTKIRSRKFLLTSLVLLQLAIFGSRSYAQTLRQRLSLQMETSFNRTEDYYSQASFSLGSEVKCWIANKFYAGLKLDVGVGSFGDNDYSISSSGGFSVYSYREARLATMSSLSLKGYYEFHFMKTRMFLGYGYGKFMGTGIIGYKTLPISSISTFVDSRRLESAWMKCHTIGVRADVINFSFSFNSNFKADKYRNINDQFSATLGFEFGNGKNLSRFKGKSVYHLPLLMLDAGYEILVPFGNKSGGASANRFSFEPKIALTHKSSLGVGVSNYGGSLGYDANGWPFDKIYIKDGIPTLPLVVPPYNGRASNEISLVKSVSLFYDHYFSKKNGWIYLGGGLGRYRSIGRESWIETDDFGQPIITPAIPKETALGYLLRLGYKTGSFRTGFNVNFVGKHIPFHIGFHMGIEPGFFKGDVKSLIARSAK